MATKLTPKAIGLIEGKNFAHLATLSPDGSPHVAPVWVDHDGDVILINTAVGRIKQRNVTKDPRVSISIVDQNNPYERTTIKGRVTEQTKQGADAHIDKLAKKYTGSDKYQNRQPGEQRIILKIVPIRVTSS
ncbi:MAG TPA: PPOX class F420-dependent oxidoreductase [Candidatus Bathyarchaeia archaeon]|nr:PPOX class F420-dependent oxidoreductase [Candidatus Bathyarchaeia archaeon]